MVGGGGKERWEKEEGEFKELEVCLELLPHVGINRSLDVMRRK